MLVGQNEKTIVMNKGLHEEIVNRMLQLINESYIFPDVGVEVRKYILRKLHNNEYADISDPAKFIEAITNDLQHVSKDKHLGLTFHPVPMKESKEDKKRAAKNRKRLLSLHNYGFEKIERLQGNIGYHKTLKFFETELAGELAIASMNFLADTSAIIFDLRDNTGGHSSMVALILSYLFEGRVHLNNFYWRKDNQMEQLWTNSHIEGPSLKDKKVFVLTSQRTFSGAEDFAYTLKHLNRATIIGERTKGGAHPGGFQRINDYFSVNIPIGRAINPITNDNWEGKGVLPHIEVQEGNALTVAQYLSCYSLLKNSPDVDIMGKTWESIIDKLESELKGRDIYIEDLLGKYKEF